MSTKRRSNVVAKALLVTALASGIAGMQALPVSAAQTYNTIDLNNSFDIIISSSGDGSNTSSDVCSLYYIPTDSNGLKGGLLYIKHDIIKVSDNFSNRYQTYTALGDAKSILGGSSSGLSEEQKTMIKDLIANWPGLCRLVEKFFERNGDNDEYEKT